MRAKTATIAATVVLGVLAAVLANLVTDRFSWLLVIALGAVTLALIAAEVWLSTPPPSRRRAAPARSFRRLPWIVAALVTISIAAIVTAAMLDRSDAVESATVTVVAGTGVTGFSGNGGPGPQAKLWEPTGLAVDGANNLYIADLLNNMIRRVDASGRISAYAGTGIEGFSGDGGPAAQAHLNKPNGVAVDSAGNVYIADTSNHRIRRVDAHGQITTVAGTGAKGHSGDGAPATKAQLAIPAGVAVDADGNLFIAENDNNRIRFVDSRGNIHTLAGTGTAGVSGDGGPAVDAQLMTPTGVAVDGAHNLYVAAWNDNRIRKIDARGRISTVTGTDKQGFSGDGGPAVQAQLTTPYAVAIDGAGNLYVADSANQRIRRVDTQGRIDTVAADLGYVEGVTVDAAGNIYFSADNRVRKITAARP